MKEKEIREHYKNAYKYDNVRQMRSGKFFERRWFKSRISMLSSDIRRHCKHPDRMLDAGCGTGAIVNELAKNFNRTDFFAFDISKWSIVKACEYYPEDKVRYAIADAFCMPFRSGAFDCVMTTEVIEHVLDPRTIVDEIERTLKPGGILMIDTPFKYHPIWNLGILRKLASSEKKGEYAAGKSHYEPYHGSYSAKDLMKLCSDFQYIGSSLVGMGVTLHAVFKKSS